MLAVINCFLLARLASLQPLLADINFRAWGITEIIIAIIVIAAVVAVMYVALQQFGVAIPGWVIKIFWICVVAFVAIVAIRFLLSL